MIDRATSSRRILVVEDEYLLAAYLAEELEDLGFEVLGPVATIDEAMRLIAGGLPVSAALLDVNLAGSMIFPVAERLQDLAVPFAFTTGYDSFALPEEFSTVPVLNKPFRAKILSSFMSDFLKIGTV